MPIEHISPLILCTVIWNTHCISDWLICGNGSVSINVESLSFRAVKGLVFSHIYQREVDVTWLSYEFVFLWQYMSLYSVYYMALSSYNPTQHSNKVQYESLTHSGTHAIPACSSGSKLTSSCANEANCSQMIERLTMSMKYETFDSCIL